MEIVILISTALKLSLAVAAMIGVIFALRRFDSLCGFQFKEWIQNADDSAIASYLGLRVLAVCILLGLVISG